MNASKLAMHTVFIPLIIILTIATDVAMAASGYRSCAIKNDSDYTAKVTLNLTPSSSTYNITLYKGQSFTIPNDYYCHKSLRGTIQYTVFTKDIVSRCTGNTSENVTPESCPDDCNSSSWNIKLLGTEFHFIKQ